MAGFGDRGNFDHYADNHTNVDFYNDFYAWIGTPLFLPIVRIMIMIDDYDYGEYHDYHDDIVDN